MADCSPGQVTDMTLDDKTAIVTGAANGLGRREALALAQAGAGLVLNDVDAGGAQGVADGGLLAGPGY